MSETTLHYGIVGFTVQADAAGIKKLGDDISSAVRQGGNFVTIPTPTGDVRALFTAGVPVWFTESEGPEHR
ncbi:MAG TPA: hypothetical protein VF612_13755 [Jatrophihabitans sp.]|jgi:hypothetical protein|uniref:hypothetical protein n=1 Tax=Jatrophihabitans sp. TaxID=1932789 RepID=UPI002EFEC4E1